MLQVSPNVNVPLMGHNVTTEVSAIAHGDGLRQLSSVIPTLYTYVVFTKDHITPQQPHGTKWYQIYHSVASVSRVSPDTHPIVIQWTKWILNIANNKRLISYGLRWPSFKSIRSWSTFNDFIELTVPMSTRINMLMSFSNHWSEQVIVSDLMERKEELCSTDHSRFWPLISSFVHALHLSSSTLLPILPKCCASRLLSSANLKSLSWPKTRAKDLFNLR